MRIHSNIITADAVRQALTAEKDAGRIARHVTFKNLGEYGSRSHARAIEIQLEANERDNGRRAGNAGAYGAMRPEVDGYAATYDEWGWLLSALYALDFDMIVGTPKHPVYMHRDDFDNRTGFTYNPAELVRCIETDGGDPYPYVTGQAAKTKRGYLIGRRGANRATESFPDYWGRKHMPRTAAEVMDFAHMDRAQLIAAQAVAV